LSLVRTRRAASWGGRALDCASKLALVMKHLQSRPTGANILYLDLMATDGCRSSKTRCGPHRAAQTGYAVGSGRIVAGGSFRTDLVLPLLAMEIVAALRSTRWMVRRPKRKAFKRLIVAGAPSARQHRAWRRSVQLGGRRRFAAARCFPSCRSSPKLLRLRTRSQMVCARQCRAYFLGVKPRPSSRWLL